MQTAVECVSPSLASFSYALFTAYPWALSLAYACHKVMSVACGVTTEIVDVIKIWVGKYSLWVRAINYAFASARPIFASV